MEREDIRKHRLATWYRTSDQTQSVTGLRREPGTTETDKETGFWLNVCFFKAGSVKVGWWVPSKSRTTTTCFQNRQSCPCSVPPDVSTMNTKVLDAVSVGKGKKEGRKEDACHMVCVCVMCCVCVRVSDWSCPLRPYWRSVSPPFVSCFVSLCSLDNINVCMYWY